MKNLMCFLLVFMLSLNGFCMSSCRTTNLEGATPGIGKFNIYSTTLTGINTLLVASEGDSVPENQKKARDIITGTAGFYSVFWFYFASISNCPEVDISHYKELLELRKQRLALEEVELGAITNMKPIPTQEELEQLIIEWKDRQKKVTKITGIVNTLLQSGMAFYSNSEVNKAIAGLSAISTMAMFFYDVDNLYNDKAPYWVDYSIFQDEFSKSTTSKINVVFKF